MHVASASLPVRIKATMDQRQYRHPEHRIGPAGKGQPFPDPRQPGMMLPAINDV